MLAQPLFIDADKTLKDFDIRVSDNDLEGAVKLLQESIDKGGALVIRNGVTYEFNSARSTFASKLLSSDIKVLSAYRTLFDPSAEELFNKGAANFDKTPLLELLDVYGASSFASNAKRTLGDYFFMDGEFGSAYQYYTLSGDKNKLTLFKTAVCLEKMENFKEAESIYTELIKKYPEEIFTIGGSEQALKYMVSERINKIPAEKRLFKNPSNISKASVKWEALELSSNSFERSDPVVTGENIYISSGKTLYALGKDWGNIIWSLPQPEAAKGVLVEGLNRRKQETVLEVQFSPALCGTGVTYDSELLAVRYFFSGIAYGVLEAKTGKIINSFSENRQPAVVVVNKNSKPSKNIKNIIMEKEEIEPVNASAKIDYTASHSLLAQEKEDVYMGILSTKGYYLVKSSRGKKDFIWSVLLGSGEQEEYKFVNAPAPLVSLSEVFIETNQFTVACVDKTTGILKWSYGTALDDKSVGNRFSEQEPPYKNMLADRTALYYAPKHSEVITALSRLTGSKIWEVKRTRNERLIFEAGDFFYTSDFLGINKILKADGKRTVIFKTAAVGRTGKVAYLDGWFYFPSGKSIFMTDLSGVVLKEFKLDILLCEVFPLKEGVLAVCNNRLVYLQDKERCLEAFSKVRPGDSNYAAAAIASALLLPPDKEGRLTNTLEELKRLKKTLTGDAQIKKVEIKLNDIALSLARSYYNQGDYPGCKELLEELSENSEEGKSAVNLGVVWMLLKCYEMTKDPKTAAYSQKIIKEYGTSYFEPEEKLKISVEYYNRVMQSGARERFADAAQMPKNTFNLRVPLFRGTKTNNHVSDYPPVISANTLFTTDGAFFTAQDLVTYGFSRLKGDFNKKKLNTINYGAYGFYPGSTAGDTECVYFCGPNFNIFGLDPKSFELKFDWKPEKDMPNSFLPYDIKVTKNLIILYDPATGFFAIDREKGRLIYELKGEFYRPSFYKDAFYAVRKENMVLSCFEATTGFTRWNLDLRIIGQSLQLLQDDFYLYVITEEGIIYKVSNGGVLAASKRVGSGKADLMPSFLSDSNIYMNTGRVISCVSKATLENKWTRDTYIDIVTEVKKSNKKGVAPVVTVKKVEKPLIGQFPVESLFQTGKKLLIFYGRFVDVCDPDTGKVEYSETQLFGNAQGTVLRILQYNGKLILMKGIMTICLQPGESIPAAVIEKNNKKDNKKENKKKEKKKNK
ncbi:MAG: tetratricopeptide repeat protein [Candidatus Firestonebacteria bacterium]|nr:tetratricopeptide repeat protein [Candidatus Firestonebacteria bacterium]